MRLLLVDRQFQLLHHVLHCQHRFVRAVTTADNKIISVVDDMGAESFIVTLRLPAKHKPTHVEVA